MSYQTESESRKNKFKKLTNRIDIEKNHKEKRAKNAEGQKIII